jgi:uncharacterized RDD family membrane protein YckC
MEDLLNDFLPRHTNASVGKRFLGALIDYTIYFISYVLVLMFFGTEHEYSGSSRSLDGWAAFFTIVGSWFVLRIAIESVNNGQSIGKAIVGARVLKLNGESAGFGRILVRHLFDWVDYFPFFGLVGIIVASQTDNKQRVGDLVAGTIVVNTRD